jgi:hypothetical protein
MSTNNEFEWRSQMRKLGEQVEPDNDLWPGIAARIAQESARRQRPRWTRAAAAIAATLVIATGASLVAVHVDHAPTASSPTMVAGTATAQIQDVPTAFDWAQPSDPKLAAAARDLDKAGADLAAALEARPDAVFLVSMINRTNAQRMRLMRQSAISG